VQRSIDLEAARLALLMARAGISRKTKLLGPYFRLPSLDQRFTADEIIQRLALASKPLLCTAREFGGGVEITYSRLEPGTRDWDWHEMVVHDMREHGGMLRAYLARDPNRDPNINIDDILIYCVGWQESQLVSLPVVEQWHQDYSTSANLIIDGVDNPWCYDDPQYLEAKTKGARGILRFSSPADDKGGFHATIRVDM
jgi:hypothetical protein